MANWMAYLRQHADDSLGDLFELLRIPSISSLTEHAADVERAARWVAERLRRAGIEHVEVLPTGGRPVVYGDWLHSRGKPTITIYGHFDVQPTDPVELWTTPPFEPAIRDGRVYARGATDNKGNMLIPILTLDAMLRTSGSLPVNVKLFLEGQEEIGSPQLPAFLAAHRDLLASDLVVNTDLGMWGEDQPALLVASKGLCAMQIDVRGARSDLHSGIYGGGVANPLHALARILDSMRSPDGEILVKGFYDGVAPLSDAERAHIAAIPFDERQTSAELGVPALVAEPGYTPIQHMWARPTLEVNGMWGGFQGEGIKTVLPNEAHAKVSCRLVPEQDPARVLRLLEAHVGKATPAGVVVTVESFPSTAKPYAISSDHPAVRIAFDVLEDVYGVAPVFTRTGGSVPVCELFQDTLGIPTVSFGFGLDDEQLHAPNEFFRLKSFERGQVAYGKLLEALGSAPRVR